ncbi:alpha-actinin [Gnomoniopsis smithogilvyi]|uniref:Alpha-actinin n=1 Tax=Gnomoniopsis smithogilvyi TaxID=1191159 RepID=A0A9W8YU02_9PEZI|nr:alpha-actinin [Gnomoniopsis smithogilvyi]
MAGSSGDPPCLLASGENNDNCDGAAAPGLLLPSARVHSAVTSGRPHSLSAASSTFSDDAHSDFSSNYDSRRSTISSVCSDTYQHQQAKYGQLQLQPQPPQPQPRSPCRSTSGGSTPHFSNSPQPWNNSSNNSTSSPASTSTSTSSPSHLTRNRENARQLHQERLQRQRAASGASNSTTGSAYDDDNLSTTSAGSPVRLRRKRGASTRKYQPANPKAALAATEPPHENLLTKMAFAEQQRWITVQQKTFTKWLNTKIEARGMEVADLVKDLSDGRFENVNLGLDFIKSRGIQMTNIGAEDVVDGNRKIILGLIWTLILRFTISDINEAGMSAKEGLLLWCQRKTACYEECDVRDFSGSWNDGLAFCALLDIHRPDLIDYDELDKSDHRGNMQLAFDLAHKEIGIPKLLDVEDVCDVAKPDERSLMTYIAYWFHAFSQMEKVENAGRRVEKFVNNMQGAWEMSSEYERRMRALLKAIREQVESWQTAKFEGTYADAKAQAMEFSAYKRGEKRRWVAEKSELATLLGNIKTKLGTYRLKPYEPPVELSLDTLDKEWGSLSSAEMARGQLINETIRDIKNALRKSFADKANDFAMALNTMQLAISGLEGDVEDQLHHVRKLSDNLPPMDAYLAKIADVDAKCQEANIEENDFTTYTYDELCYELSLVQSSVSKKLSFLDNQMVARSMTNLTPIQLEEFESVFRHFDRDDSNNLQEIEFSAALASLGLVFSEDEMHDYFMEASEDADRVSFEQFIRFMVDVTEDQNTADQVFQSFREVADGKPYVTEMDLRHSLVPDEVIEKLTELIPLHTGPDMQADRGQPQYDYIAFMDRLIADERMASGGRSSPSKGGPLNDVTNGSGPRSPGKDGKTNGLH